VGLRLGGRTERALRLLEPALAPLRVPRYDFFCRLERCRAAAQAGAQVAGIASAIRIAQRCVEWFEPTDTAMAARRAAALVQVRLCERWAEKLAQDGRLDELADANRLIRVLRARFLPQATTVGEPADVLRLGQVVPLLVTAPPAASAPSVGTSAPASRPAGSAPPAASRPASG